VSLSNPLSAPLGLRTILLIFTLGGMIFDSPAHSQTAARFISNQQWEAEIQITLNPEARDRESMIDRLLADQLLGKLKVQRVAYDFRKQPGREGRPTYALQLRGTEGFGQFRKALFSATDPTGPFVDGPVLLELSGSVRSGEPLTLILESNLASGYVWEVQTLEAMQLKTVEAVRFESSGRGLGGATRQIITLEGVTGGGGFRSLRIKT